MGVDCKVRVGDEYTSLDRWYVFDQFIQSDKVMTRSEALRQIRRIKRGLSNRMKKEWGDRQEEFIQYYEHWITVARKAIKTGGPKARIIFYDDHDIPNEYYDNLKKEPEK